jgi:hypothetical protein
MKDNLWYNKMDGKLDSTAIVSVRASLFLLSREKLDLSFKILKLSF